MQKRLAFYLWIRGHMETLTQFFTIPKSHRFRNLPLTAMETCVCQLVRHCVTNILKSLLHDQLYFANKWQYLTTSGVACKLLSTIPSSNCIYTEKGTLMKSPIMGLLLLT